MGYDTAQIITALEIPARIAPDLFSGEFAFPKRPVPDKILCHFKVKLETDCRPEPESLIVDLLPKALEVPAGRNVECFAMHLEDMIRIRKRRKNSGCIGRGVYREPAGFVDTFVNAGSMC